MGEEMSHHKHDPHVEERLKSLQTRLNSGVFRSPAMEKMDASIDQLQGVIDNLIQNIDPDKIECTSIGDIYKLGIATAGLSRAKAENEKLKLEAENQYQRAMDEFREQIRADLADYPEVAMKLRQIASEAAKKLSKRKKVGRPLKKER
jgi:hypothetical protein